MINYTFTSDDVKMVEKFIEIRNKGYYCDGGQLTTVYNRVLHKNSPTTNCGSCMRARISELETALQAFKATLAVDSKEDKGNAPTSENKRITKSKKKG